MGTSSSSPASLENKLENDLVSLLRKPDPPAFSLDMTVTIVIIAIIMIIIIRSSSLQSDLPKNRTKTRKDYKKKYIYMYEL